MKKHNSGQSMFEVVIALFVVSMIIIGIVSLSTISLSNAVFSRNKTLASKYTQESSEWLRNEKEKDISLFVSKATNLSKYCLQTNGWTIARACLESEYISDFFKREVTFKTSQIGSGKNIIEAEIITSWQDSKGYHESKSITTFSDYRQQ